MITKRKFYKTIVSFEIISEDAIDTISLEEIAYETTEGRWSGRFLDTTQQELDGLQTAKALEAQGSDPEFLGLTSAGEDEEEARM